MILTLPLAAALVAIAACGNPETTEPAPVEPPTEPAAATPTAGTPADHLLDEREVHLRNLRQLTFGGENAEAYFSSDGRQLIFQSKRDDLECDQIFVMDLETEAVQMVSGGDGRTTCAYFFPGRERILYSSTHASSAACPPPPDFSRGYVWKLYPEFEIFAAAPTGGDLVQLTDNDAYDAEATISPDGETIIFTSSRDGDLELYTMKPDGTDVRQITDQLGYDGGAFFSRDGERIVWRASRPKTDEERAAYMELLETSAIKPMNLEIFVADADGGNARQITKNGAANFAPFFFPDGKRVIFASNMGDSGGRLFDLWMVGDDGTGLEQVTFHEEFDSFPMFSPDGKQLVFASNRGGKVRGETNLFLAEWVD
jgi:Tol biopolymer transport system component